MAVHGTLTVFDSRKETWDSYSERMSFYFLANDINDDGKKKAIFLSACGSHTFDLLRNLLQPAKPAEKTYDELVEILKTHYAPKPSVITQRYKFNTRIRQQGESVSTYVAELKAIAEFCDFPNLEQMLRDQLVCGIADLRIQKRLLQDAGLTYKTALETALSMEMANKDVTQLQRSPGAVHNVQHRSTNRFTQRFSCYRCGGNHAQESCRFKSAQCHYCKKMGHIAPVCRSRNKRQDSTAPARTEQSGRQGAEQSRRGPLEQQKKPPKSGATQRFHSRTASFRPVHTVKDDQQTQSQLPESLDTPPPQGSSSNDVYSLFKVESNHRPLIITLCVNKVDLPMELDTGASVSIISESTYFSFFRSTPLQPSEATLKSYTGESITVCGQIEVFVEYADQTATLPLVVVQGNGATLLGRNWLEEICLDWNAIHSLQLTRSSLESVLAKYQRLFDADLGTFNGPPIQLWVDKDATPRFFKPRLVPYSLKQKIESELERLQSLNVITPVKYSDWAAPIVPVLKQDGSVRLCGDYKVTINQVSPTESYPLPRVEELFTALSGGKLFSKLDLSSAYQQVSLHEDSRKYTTINMHKGLFQYLRLPFGISSAPAMFQRIMETVLQGLPKVCVYIDDILVSGTDEADHNSNLTRVLDRLQSSGFTLKKSKCVFSVPSIEYLGHIIDGEGLHPSKSKLNTIQNAPLPTNVTELKSFLGLLNYYHKFLPNLSTELAPLHQLLNKGVNWKWTKEHSDTYQHAKDLLQSSQVLVHFDSDKPIILSCDASPYGVGGVLAHVMPDGSERPITYTSRTLSSAEKNYSQLEREALAIIFSVKRFHQYLYGHSFILYSDHKPLEHLLHETRQIPSMASSRIQRWALALSAYNYTIKYKPGKQLSNADALSRLPLPEVPSHVPIPGDVFHIFQHLEESVITAKDLSQWTSKDPLLSRVCRQLQTGWSLVDPPPDMKPYHQRRNELSVVDGCLLLGSRVIVPKEGRERVLKQLHIAHPGICRMKSLARSYVWWPGIDRDVEQLIQNCAECQEHKANPVKAPLHPWEIPRRPWSRIHIDHAGPFLNKMFLIVVDAFSKWLEVCIVPSTSSEATIRALRPIFATHGIPDQLVSDNGTGFTSAEFKSFLKELGVHHICTAPYHPSSNGLAERAVQTFKTNMRKLDGDLHTKLFTMLFQYRLTPQTATGLSPAEMLMGRKLCNQLDLLHPDTSNRLTQKQQNWSKNGRATTCRRFQIGDTLFARNYRGTPVWIPVSVVRVTGPVSYGTPLWTKILMNDIPVDK